MTTDTAQAPAFIRTSVPLLVAALVGWLGTLGVLLPETASAGLVTFVSTLAGILWYAGVRCLEAKWPALGVLLGSTKTPTYEPLAVLDDGPHYTEGQLLALLSLRDALPEGDDARDAIESVLPPRHLDA